ncbi:MAG: hypothetical protein ACHQ51_14230 [Elusimicrobiota bacterium]
MLTAVLVLAFASPVFASSPTQNEVSVSAPAGLEFHAICKAAKIPCALELDVAASGDPRGRAPFRVEDATVSQAMNQAIKRYPGHRWRFRKGVLYVTPNAPDANTPLDRPLGRAKFLESLGSLRDDFGASAGFCDAPRGTDAGPAPAPSEKLPLSVDDATPRAVLNAFVFRQGHAGWAVVRTALPDGKALYCLDLIVYDR